MDPIVIIGSGLAGYSLARELRKLDKTVRLRLITRDDGRYYSKPMLSNGYAQGKDADALALNTPQQMAEQLQARIDTHTTVAAIDTSARHVVTGAETIGYHRLVLALGADPIRIALGGNAAEAVLSVNDLGDYARFRRAAEHKRRALILGAGLIGCEFANDLAGAGFEVAVADIAAQPLPRLLPPQAAESLRAALAGLGVRWHFGSGAKAVDRADDGYRVSLTDGSDQCVDIVLSAVGLRPRTALAASAGLEVGRGIVTGAYLETSAEGVYALGDCAEVCGHTLPFVMPIMHAARALARTLAGTPTRVNYPAMPVVVKTPALATVVCPPPADIAGGWHETSIDGGVRALFHDGDGRLRGFALTGEASKEKLALAKQLPPLLA